MPQVLAALSGPAEKKPEARPPVQQIEITVHYVSQSQKVAPTALAADLLFIDDDDDDDDDDDAAELAASDDDGGGDDASAAADDVMAAADRLSASRRLCGSPKAAGGDGDKPAATGASAIVATTTTVTSAPVAAAAAGSNKTTPTTTTTTTSNQQRRRRRPTVGGVAPPVAVDPHAAMSRQSMNGLAAAPVPTNGDHNQSSSSSSSDLSATTAAQQVAVDATPADTVAAAGDPLQSAPPPSTTAVPPASGQLSSPAPQLQSQQFGGHAMSTVTTSSAAAAAASEIKSRVLARVCESELAAVRNATAAAPVPPQRRSSSSSISAPIAVRCPVNSGSCSSASAVAEAEAEAEAAESGDNSCSRRAVGINADRRQLCRGDAHDDDPYAELEYYLENVKREINEVFEQYNQKQQHQHHPKPAAPSSLSDGSSNASQSPLVSPGNGASTIRLCSPPPPPLPTASATGGSRNEADAMRVTTEWANHILRELNTLMPVGKERLVSNSSSGGSTGSLPRVIGRNTGGARSSMAAADRRSSPVAVPQHRAMPPAAALQSGGGGGVTERDKNGIPMPKKHIYIPLQSFKLDESLLSPTLPKSPATPTTPAPLHHHRLSSPPPPPRIHLQIDEDRFGRSPPPSYQHQPYHYHHHPHHQHQHHHQHHPPNTRTAATQTRCLRSPTGSSKKTATKTSTSTLSIWTSDESILKSSAYTVDDDNKSSTSSSATSGSTSGTSAAASPSCDGRLSASGKSAQSLDSDSVDILLADVAEWSTGKVPEPRISSASWCRMVSVGTQTFPALQLPAIAAHRRDPEDDDEEEDEDDDDEDEDDDQLVRLTVLKRLDAAEDPDLLEVLSLCNDIGQTYDSDEADEDEEEDDDEEELTIDQLIAGAQSNQLLNSSFGTETTATGTTTTTTNTTTDASSCSNKSLLLSDEAEVVLRTKNQLNSMSSTANLSDCSLPGSRCRFRPQTLRASSPKFGRNGLRQLDRCGSYERRPFALHIGGSGDGGGSGGCSGGGSEAGSCASETAGGGEGRRHLIGELPSPSSASLNSGTGRHLLDAGLELGVKSSSAPVLREQREQRRRREEFGEQTMNLRYSRSQSDRYLAEIEAAEACKWLRAAGFPQYAQMYEDLQFPIDLSHVAKDHPFLENDPLQSLYRRLVALNRCATMRLDSSSKPPSKTRDESEDDEYALSENWTLDQKNRRWSRVGDQMAADIATVTQHHRTLGGSSAGSAGSSAGSDRDGPTTGASGGGTTTGGEKSTADSRESSCEKLSGGGGQPHIGIPSVHPVATCGGSGTLADPAADCNNPVRFRRTGSERLKDGAKALLRRVESIKSRRRKRQNRDGIVCEPTELDLSGLTDGPGRLSQARSQPPSPLPGSPLRLPGVNVVAADYGGHGNRLSPQLQYGGSLGAGRKSATLGYPTAPQHSHSQQTSPMHFFHQPHQPHLHHLQQHHHHHHHALGSADESSSYFSDASQESSEQQGQQQQLGTGGANIPKKRPSRTRRFLQKSSGKVDVDVGALSDSECHHLLGSGAGGRRNATISTTVTLPSTVRTDAKDDPETSPTKLQRGGSLNLGKDGQQRRGALKSRSFRSRSSCRKTDGWSSSGYGEGDEQHKPSSKAVLRWHSFQNQSRTGAAGLGQPQLPLLVASLQPELLFRKCGPGGAKESTGMAAMRTSLGGGAVQPIEPAEGMPLAAMSCGQIQGVRKLALSSLTGSMERYCPTHRSGWNWEFTKFIKKIKAPDYKERKVFGVPFLLLLQRSGETLPRAIQSAIKWLRMNAMDQIGIFRKSGVKSRIAKLKEVVEESPVDQPMATVLDIQQAYDVADMVKQYFRELPDMLLTAKLSETFVAIFLHLPPDKRPDAVQSAVLLLPDEHREVLQHLLEFLANVAANAESNQMTANNLAVCLAPSLFHGGVASMRAAHAPSPRRRRPAAAGVGNAGNLGGGMAASGLPDDRELAETRASHECLTYLIENVRAVFTVSADKLTRCNFGYMEESRPVTLTQLGQELPGKSGWQNYLLECTSATVKEGREKSRGWISNSSFDAAIEIAYKKVGDGHPLRLWRCTTEVAATPQEVMEFIYGERQRWDGQLLKWRVVRKLDERSEVFQYAVGGGQGVTDYCVLRSYTTGLTRSRDACVIVETSVEHPDAPLLLGGVRGVVLASRYLIEPAGHGKSKIMHLARVDIKGKTPEWYNKSYGHICSHNLAKIRNAFRQKQQQLQQQQQHQHGECSAATT